jgi:hypothetical protein
MWLFTKYGFFSVVCARASARPGAPVDPSKVMIRARCRKHLEALVARFVDAPKPGDRSEFLDWVTVHIVESRGTDYPFRVFLPKAVWADAAHDLMSEIDYDDFKHHVAETMGDDRAYLNALHSVWSVGRGLSR